MGDTSSEPPVLTETESESSVSAPQAEATGSELPETAALAVNKEPVPEPTTPAVIKEPVSETASLAVNKEPVPEPTTPAVIKEPVSETASLAVNEEPVPNIAALAVNKESVPEKDKKVPVSMYFNLAVQCCKIFDLQVFLELGPLLIHDCHIFAMLLVKSRHF
jgi:hypothetical protein